MILLASCANKEEVAAPEYVPEGEPARISLTLSVPDMDPISRAAGIDPDAAAARTVNNLWLGFFNPSGDCIFKYSVPTLEATSNPHNMYGTIKLENVPALSGNCMIVAVANARTTNAVNVKSGKTGNLWTLLENIGTKEEFDQLSVIMPSSTEIARVSSSSFVMCGVYTEAGDAHGNKDVPTEVTIYPDVNQTLPGRIHLRRLDAYVKFEIRPNANITLTPVSWQVCNLPSASYVYEHMAATADNPFVNAGDHNWSNSGQAAKNTHYNNTLVYAASNFDPIFNNGQNVGYQFDFYQYENKRTGRISAGNGFDIVPNPTDGYYGLREKEFKNEVDGSNTGWYRSLVAEPGTVIPAEPTYIASLANNNATYVVIRAHVEYYHRNNELVPPGSAGATLRTGDVIYTVHLGYCSGSGLDKANDYNCRRNAKYTYRISVNGVDDIRVEAIEEAPGAGENQSGAEGTITDLISTMFDIDSHYGVVNIQLSDNQRRNLVWRVQSPFEEKLIDMVGGNANQANVFGSSALINTADDAEMQAALPRNQFYNWIQIRPTTGENILAQYPGDPRLKNRRIRNDDSQVPDDIYPTDQIIVNDGEDKGGVWFLNDLADPDNYPHPDRTGNGNTPRWYTIFIDEYVYEYEYVEPEKSKSMTEYYGDELVDDGTGEFEQSRTMDVERWRTYVNRDSRRVWIALSNMAVSTDGESIYSNSQYLITQESIQTYYGDDAPQGIGIESTNESYIGPTYANVWNWVDYNNNVYDPIDGLLNQYNFVRSYRWTGSNSTGVRWDNILKHPNGTGNYPSNNNWNEPRLRTRGKRHILNIEEDVTYYIPDHPDYMMAACLSRNRDLNNDGIIGANEIRWYLPTTAVYSRIMLGAQSLRSPLFNVRDYPRDNSYLRAGTGTGYSHYYGSDHDQLWAEEFGATGSLTTGTATTIRCIRNIGQPTNLSPDDGNDGYETINAAYHQRVENGVKQNIIDLLFYDLAALRPATDGYIAGHELSDIMSYASAAFQFARADCSTTNTTANQLNLQGLGFSNSNITGYNRTRWTDMLAVNGICGAYHEDGDGGAVWRVPNITELAILYHLGLLTSGTTYSSCSHEYLSTWSTDPNTTRRYMGTNATTITATIPTTTHIRCVRDVPRIDQ